MQLVRGPLIDGFACPSGSAVWSAIFSNQPSPVYDAAFLLKRMVSNSAYGFDGISIRSGIGDGGDPDMCAWMLQYQKPHPDRLADRKDREITDWCRQFELVDVGTTVERDYTALWAPCAQLVLAQAGVFDEHRSYRDQLLEIDAESIVDRQMLKEKFQDYVSMLVAMQNKVKDLSRRYCGEVGEDVINFIRTWTWRDEHVDLVARGPIAIMFAASQTAGTAQPSAKLIRSWEDAV